MWVYSPHEAIRSFGAVELWKQIKSYPQEFATSFLILYSIFLIHREIAKLNQSITIITVRNWAVNCEELGGYVS